MPFKYREYPEVVLSKPEKKYLLDLMSRTKGNINNGCPHFRFKPYPSVQSNEKA